MDERGHAGGFACDVGYKPTANAFGFVVHYTVCGGARVGERVLERSHSPEGSKELFAPVTLRLENARVAAINSFPFSECPLRLAPPLVRWSPAYEPTLYSFGRFVFRA
jgi:hypothetical protein